MDNLELLAALVEADLQPPYDLVSLLMGGNNQYRSLSEEGDLVLHTRPRHAALRLIRTAPTLRVRVARLRVADGLGGGAQGDGDGQADSGDAVAGAEDVDAGDGAGVAVVALPQLSARSAVVGRSSSVAALITPAAGWWTWRTWGVTSRPRSAAVPGAGPRSGDAGHG